MLRPRRSTSGQDARARVRRTARAVALLAIVGASAIAVPAGASAPHTGWVVSIASPTATTPDWAYPFASGDELTTSNVEGFEQLMYRPLYFFGGSRSVELDAALSLATPPSYADGDTSVSFTVKAGLRWSDGEPVSAEGVVEWLNLVTSFPGLWGDYLAPLADGTPLGLPDDLRGVAVSGQTVTLTLSGPVNPTWFTDSELSQITPLPASWDVYEPARPHVPLTGPASVSANHGDFTAATSSGGCYATRWVGQGTTGPSSTFVDPLGDRTVVPAAGIAQAQRCVDVVELLRSLSADTADYTTAGTDVAATWGRVDGPWRLLDYDAASGAISMAPNRAAGASGAHAAASLLRFVPCATAAGCAGLLEHGLVDQGALPLADAPHVTSLTAGPARNPLRTKGYRETVVAPWATSYFPYNFASTFGAAGRAGRVFAQRYFRIAFQSLVDQRTEIDTDLGGYGVMTTGPVPSVPASGFVVSTVNPAPFGVGAAAALLAAHGWHVAPGHETTCVRAARCGPGIARGTPLSFTLEFAPSSGATAGELTLLARDALRVGIRLHLLEVTAPRLFADVTGPNRNWDLASWGGGWQYAPGYFPSGEWTFATGSPWNVGGYHDPQATSLVEATLRAPSQLAAYDAYVSQQLPVVWQPTPVTLLETKASITGVVASPLGALTPEAWRP